jgi:hypothetical protein
MLAYFLDEINREMDRYLAWIITSEKLNPDAEIPEILKPAHPKLVMMGFIIAISIMIFLTSLGYIIYD